MFWILTTSNTLTFNGHVQMPDLIHVAVLEMIIKTVVKNKYWWKRNAKSHLI